MNAKNTKAVIENADPKLVGLLKQFTMIKDYETRCRSKGSDSLYIRMTRPNPTMNIAG